MGAGLFSSAQPSYAAVRAGTLAPFLRALLRPMAIACLRFFTGCLPDFMRRISVRTSCWTFLPYLRPLDFLLLGRDDDLLFDDDLVVTWTSSLLLGRRRQRIVLCANSD